MTTTTQEKPTKVVDQGSLMTLGEDNIITQKPFGFHYTPKTQEEIWDCIDRHSGIEKTLITQGAFMMWNFLASKMKHNSDQLKMVRHWLETNADLSPPETTAEDSANLLQKMDEFKTEGVNNG